MNNFVTVEISGKDVKRFVRTLYKRGIRFYHLQYQPHSVEAVISYRDYLKLKDLKTIYEIRVLRFKGWIRLFQLFSIYKVFLCSLCFGIFLLYFLSHVIFSVEVIHDREEIRNFVLEELGKRGIQKFSFVKSFDAGEAVVADLLNTYRDQLEWMEIERIGTKYIVRVEERKVQEDKEDSGPRDLIAKKKGMILSITAIHGEVVKKVHDYVEAGDIILSGTIKNKDTIKDYVRSEGQVFAETWYHITVEVPYSYKEIRKTGNKQRVFAFQFLNFQKRLLSSFQTKEDQILFSLSNPLLPISISYLEEEETLVEDALYSYDMALLKAKEAAEEKLLSTLGEKDEIIYEKSLKNYEEDSKIIVDMFFKVKEDITSYVGITKGDIEVKEEP